MMTNEQLLPVIHRVMDKLMNLGGADYDSDKGADKASTAKGNIARDFGIEEWDWPQGVGLYGLYKLQSFYGDTRYLDFFKNWIENNLKRGLPSRNINTTTPYLAIVNLLDDLKSPEYESMCLDQARWLDELLTGEGLDRPILVGQSMGGYVGQAYAQLYPDRLQGFISIDSAPFSGAI